ncbi:MAG: PD40 domain-containing protein [Planctomycetes bacterium]|nr:PD40 domain-containing protein [Planctomycetota bacterium]
MRLPASHAALLLTAAAFAVAGCGASNECPLGPCPLSELHAADRAAATAWMAKYDQGPAKPIEAHAQERRLRNVRQLTFSGQNAECYFSFEGDQFIFQSTRADFVADQIFTMDLAAGSLRLVSSGLGKTTCGYFLPGAKRILYASTHVASPTPPAPPDYQKYGYVWKFNDGFDIFAADPDGRRVERLTATPGYDAECTVSNDGEWIVFTSMRDGDLDLYKMRVDGSDVTRLTHELGYDGGAFFTPGDRQIVYRGFTPTTPEDVGAYREMMELGMWRPGPLELRIMDADGGNKRTFFSNGASNWAPFMLPDGKRVIFSSNLHDPNPKNRNFDLYMVNVDGSGLERITFDEQFDGFPMFSPDGKHLVWAANRHGSAPRDTNLFLADWVE